MTTSIPFADELLAASWPPEVRSLSATAVKLYLKCPEDFRRQRIQREDTTPGVAMVWGSAHHRAAEHNFKAKINSGEDLPTPEVLDRFVSAVDEEVQDRGGKSSIDWTMSKKAVSLDDVKRRGLDAVQAYHEGPVKTIIPVAAEKRFSLRIAGVPVPVNGFIDVETKYRVRDLKLSGRAKTKLDPEWALQGGLYALQTGKPASFDLVTFDGRLHLPADDEVHGRLPFTVAYSMTSAAAIEDLILMVAHGIAHNYATYGPDDSWPGAITHPWACGYCSFSGDCRWYRSIVAQGG